MTIDENGDFQCGLFGGWVRRKEPQPARWDGYTKEMLPASPAYWSVTVVGIDRAWREVRLPLKRGRTMRKAVEQACSLFKSPDEIRPDEHGWFGKIVTIAS